MTRTQISSHITISHSNVFHDKMFAGHFAESYRIPWHY